MARDVLSTVITAQRRRAVATILGPLELMVIEKVTPEEWDAVRKNVLSAVGIFADFALDAVRASSEGQWVNDEALQLLNEIHQSVKRNG